MKSDRFAINKNYYETLAQLTDSQLGSLFRALFHLHLDLDLPEMDAAASVAFYFMTKHARRKHSTPVEKVAKSNAHSESLDVASAEIKTELVPVDTADAVDMSHPKNDGIADVETIVCCESIDFQPGVEEVLTVAAQEQTLTKRRRQHRPRHRQSKPYCVSTHLPYSRAAIARRRSRLIKQRLLARSHVSHTHACSSVIATLTPVCDPEESEEEDKKDYVLN